MAAPRSSATLRRLIDTWSRGANFMTEGGGLTNLGPALAAGGSVALPHASDPTVNTSESGSVESVSETSDTLTVNKPKFVNRAVTDSDRLMAMDGNYVPAVFDGSVGALWNSIHRDVIEYLLSVAATTGANAHFNLAADAITDDDVNECEAVLMDNAGGNPDESIIWIGNPIAIASVKGTANYFDGMAMDDKSGAGIGMLKSLNGKKLFTNSVVPGRSTSFRQSAATSAVSISSNVATATVASHPFVTGQMIYTTGLTANVPVGTPVAVTVNSATEVEFALVGCDGALGDGVGTIYSASSQILCVNREKAFWAIVGAIPQFNFVKREANMGYALQLGTHLGRAALADCVHVLHAPD